MINMKRTILSLLVLCAMFSLSAQDKVIRKVLETGRTDNQTMAHADFLSNRIGGRPVGSHNLQDAEAWAAGMFRSWGLEVITQEVGEIGVGFSRGQWTGRLLGAENMQLHFVTPSYTAGTRGPQRGHVLIEPRSRAEFERIKGALKGAWVLIDGDSRGFAIDRTARGDSLRAAAFAANEEIEKENREIRSWNRSHEAEQKPLKEYDSTPALFYREMVQAGALGFIQSAAVPLQALYDRAGCYDLTMETLPEACDIKLDAHQYDLIRQMVRERRDIQLEFDIRNHFFEGPVKYHNVIGVLRGSKYPDEYVILGGHLDSYDIAGGAVDDGNGVSVTMEAARLLATSGAKPKRSIMFCLWTGEEYGLLGSKYFVESGLVPLEKISNYFNRDGGPLAAVGVTVPPAMYDDFVEAGKSLLEYSEDIPFTVSMREGEPRPRPSRAGGSDHAHFAMNGVPTISFNEADIKGYDFNYREIWHTESDHYGQLIPEYMEHSSVVSAVVAYGIANLPHLLSREGLYKE